MAAGTALIALESPAIDKPMFVALATRTAEPIGPSGLLQSDGGCCALKRADRSARAPLPQNQSQGHNDRQEIVVI